MGDELRYRGYDIHDLARSATFEEVAHLLIHEELPNAYILARYKQKLLTMRGLPAPLKAVLEQIPTAAQPMDVLRTGLFGAGHRAAGTRRPADAGERATSPTGCWPPSRPC